MAKVPTGDHIKTPAGANVISITISPYNEVSITDEEAFPPKIPNHERIEYQSWSKC